MFGNPYTNPKKWETGKLEDVMVGKASNGFFTKPANYSSDGNVGVICVGDVVNRKYSNVCDLRRATADEKQIQKFKVQYGDMLFCRSSLVKEGIAKASIVPKDSSENVLFECHVIRVKLDLDRVIPEFMQAFTITDYFRVQMMDKSKTATMTTISQKDVISGTIYIPDMDLQKQFVHFAAQSDKSKFYGKSQFIEMFGLPEHNVHGFETGKISDVVKDVHYGTAKKASENGKYIYIRMNNITYEGNLDLSDIKHIDVSEKELAGCMVQQGDVLFNRTNSKDLVGKTCYFSGNEPMIIAGYIIRLRMNGKVVPEYLSIFMNLDRSKKLLYNMAKGAVGQANINSKEVQSIEIVIPPEGIQRSFLLLLKQSDKSKLSSIGYMF